MTEIYLELGGKKAIAWSLVWPGWCRIRRNALREAIAAVLSQPSSGNQWLAVGWNASYAVRRMAWHVVDHLWESEDRRG